MSLSLRDVDVRRAGRPVLDGVNFDLSPSDAILLRGGNGSGKTSLLRAVAGLAASDGEIIFSRGVQVLDAAYVRAEQVHLITPDGGHHPRLTVEETLSFESRFFGADGEEALIQLGLAPAADVKVGNLSTGQRRRLSLLRLLISPKALWLLDEPFAALDDDGKAIVHTLIDGHRARGGLVILALHDAEGIPGAQTLRVEAA